ncbi:23S rRNA (pseudouridine(1915)-N(3))-methyltransferase RlmH [Ruminococcaceae bacterium OttesenSCG-928-N02]|nr:23S rRNA (pseudouridine(1915)-N(3))-methyltransferase RlmH [Ruminococcaceae bacterium OttesenSCG-928-N02]
MQGCDIICLGKLTQNYIAEGCAEYIKRLGGYCNLRVVEITPVPPAGKTPNPAAIEKALEGEAKKIFGALRAGSELVALCVEGKGVSSPQLAGILQQNANYGSGHVTFIIGSSHGLHESVKKACAHRLSFSSMTFPHQLFRLLLLEQIYRAYTIIAGTPYHK